MKTTYSDYDGVRLIVPDDPRFFWPVQPPTEFPSCCGAGEGWKEKLVPDTIFGVCISPVCWIHDRMYEFSKPLLSDFYQANDVFLVNMVRLLRAKSSSSVLRYFRNNRAMTYYEAVEEFGESAFRDCHKGEVVK